MREIYDASLVYVAALGLGTAILNAWAVRLPYQADDLDWGWGGGLAATAFGCWAFAVLVTGGASGAALAMIVSMPLVLALKLAFPRLTFTGTLEMALTPLTWVVGSLWTYALVAESGASESVLALVIAASLFSAGGISLNFVEKLARQAMLTHGTWRRPTAPFPAPIAEFPPERRGARPKVSIQVPAYAEPPAMLNAVLDRLARLDYPDYEVLVCDNNTADEALWRPVERHCAMLNRQIGAERFRFFHVAPLAGAKAGALNWLLDHMAADADLIAVIDADYEAEPDFLARLTGFFDDPAIGYVQTPHDYREHAESAYLSACYWEYMPSNKIEMPGISEYGAAFTIGTMCLIRTTALRAAGDWAEWCLTEDSEVSVRLREVGYHGLYLRDTFGRGLIPETFDDYKKQRFRWTAGPVQQLRRHWRLYRPRALGGSRNMDSWNKLLEVMRGIAPIVQVANVAIGLVTAVALMLTIARGAVPPIDLPDVAWLVLAMGLAASLVRRWQRYRLSGCTKIGAMARGELARLSLTYVQMVAGLAGLSSRPLAWRRTPKFAQAARGLAAFRATLPETFIGIGMLAMAIVPLALVGRIGGDIAAMLAIGAVASSGRFLAAPVMAWLSERRLAGETAAPSTLPAEA
ncbi:glycosyltransferase [Sphingomonas bacterium]|uniref:glycosyltransferase n=1 Tax=Sphingomonas bacterium TaxID=1895847 RepID=UPI001576B9DC|nr:glycosyltransferase [Sphingomonas bacterium]